MDDYFSALASLRKEKETLVAGFDTKRSKENSYHREGVLIDAKGARALRIQEIDREIETLKRGALRVVYGGKHDG